MTAFEYWVEAVSSSLDEAGVQVTAEQIENIASDIQIAYEQYNMAFGYDVANDNVSSMKDNEIITLKKEVRHEQDLAATIQHQSIGDRNDSYRRGWRDGIESYKEKFDKS